MTFTKELLPDDRLVKILSETQATINEHNRRQVRGSVEVDARLLESMLAEIQLRRHLMEKAALAGVEADQGRNPVLAYADSYRDMAKQGVESIPVWSVITDLERNIAPHIIAPQPLTTSERAELDNYRNAQQVVPDFGALTKLIVQRLVDCGGADDDAIARCEEFVYNACRAAMLQGAGIAESPTTMQTAPALDSSPNIAESPSGNSPVIPDGWVMVPKEATAEMINSAMRDNETGGLDEIYELMIAAAPQQEVKP